MNYRHIYHAGNFADVVKHCILIELLNALKRKPTPFCYLDTHAGIGLYSLKAAQAQKMQEYNEGVLSVIQDAEARAALKDYLDILKSCNPSGDLSHLTMYPGSPAIARACLREDDRMVLCELHPDDCDTLKSQWCKSRQMAVHHMNGYSGMKAFLPPKENRGLVLIDPPFEKTDEFKTMADSLKAALKAWRGGQFMIWYPIKNASVVKPFYQDLKKLSVPHFIIEFSQNEKALFEGLSACGVIVINPPWKLEEQLRGVLFPVLSKALSGRFKLGKFE